MGLIDRTVEVLSTANDVLRTVQRISDVRFLQNRTVLCEIVSTSRMGRLSSPHSGGWHQPHRPITETH
jgi:hypothetical protein